MEEGLGGLAVGTIILILLAFPTYIVWFWGRELFFYITNKNNEFSDKKGEGVSPKKIKSSVAEQILNYKFSYYKKLNEEQKVEFLKRLLKFTSEKEFYAKSGLQLTEEMIVLIGASAVQLTFGLDDYKIDHFSKIFIYPAEFKSGRMKNIHKGEVNMAGAVVLSWKHFKEGYENNTDNINLGLHEMAHALNFNQHRSFFYDRFFAAYIDKFKIIAESEFSKIKSGETSYLREYAGNNMSEFFAVCVEYFFESPEELKKHLPEIFEHMKVLLNQDPSSGKISTEERKDENEEITDYGQDLMVLKPQSINFIFNILLLIPAIIVLFFAASDKASKIKVVIWLVCLFVVNFISFIFKRNNNIRIYSKGIYLHTSVFSRYNRFYKFSKIIAFTFHKSSGGKNDSNYTKVTYIKNGRLKHSHFSILPSTKEILEASEILEKNKVPVKMEGY